jgi:hypothetical protein
MHDKSSGGTEQAEHQKRQEALSALGAYQKQGAISQNVGHMADMLMDESDRGVVVILGSLIEDILLERLWEELDITDEKQRKELTRGGSLLSTFEDKIKLAQAMGVIDAEIAKSLQTMKAMRNACAHSRRHIDLQTPELANVLALLFDGESAEAIRRARTELFNRICYIAQFMVMSDIIRGLEPKIALAWGQTFFDGVFSAVTEELKKQRASRETHSKQSNPRPQKSPKD